MNADGPNELTVEQMMTVNEDFRLLGIETIQVHIRDHHCAHCRYTLEAAAHRYGLTMVQEPSCTDVVGV